MMRHWDAAHVNVNELLGKTLARVEVDKSYGDEITFTLNDGTQYVMYHEQDCCESVTIEDVNGDWEDLIGQPLTMAEESTNFGDRGADHETYTFYRFATINGYVNLRWYGVSNGYYSESVSFARKSKEAKLTWIKS